MGVLRKESCKKDKEKCQLMDQDVRYYIKEHWIMELYLIHNKIKIDLINIQLGEKYLLMDLILHYNQ